MTKGIISQCYRFRCAVVKKDAYIIINELFTIDIVYVNVSADSSFSSTKHHLILNILSKMM